MTQHFIQATPLRLEIRRVPADEFGSPRDRLDVQVWRGDEVIWDNYFARGHTLGWVGSLTPGERTIIEGLIALEWLKWPDTTATPVEFVDVATLARDLEELASGGTA